MPPSHIRLLFSDSSCSLEYSWVCCKRVNKSISQQTDVTSHTFPEKSALPAPCSHSTSASCFLWLTSSVSFVKTNQNVTCWPLTLTSFTLNLHLWLSLSQGLCLSVSLRSNSVLWLSSLQMDVVYTFQTGQAPVPGALRRQPSVVSQHNDAAAAKTLSSPTHVGLSASSSLTNSAGAPPPAAAAASSSTAGSESA